MVSPAQIKKFVDGASLNELSLMAVRQDVDGFTTNPTLMRKAGVKDYIRFAEEAAAIVSPKPISFEIGGDETVAALKEAQVIAGLRENVFVKVPVTFTSGEPTLDVIRELSENGINLNVTAVFTVDQVRRVCEVLTGKGLVVVSVFAGRIADAGIDPIPIVRTACAIAHQIPNTEVLWASPREILNLIQAEEAGADIITMTNDLWDKLGVLGTSLEDFSLDTVKMFFNDFMQAGFRIKPA